MILMKNSNAMKRMMTTLFAVLLISSAAFAQEEKKESDSKPRPEMHWNVSSSLSGPKFEIISRPDNNTAYRINKETGEVWILVYDKQYIVGIEESANTVIVPGENNFQLVLSGHNSEYLLNIQSGEVWYFKSGPLSYKGSRFILPKTVE